MYLGVSLCWKWGNRDKNSEDKKELSPYVSERKLRNINMGNHKTKNTIPNYESSITSLLDYLYLFFFMYSQQSFVLFYSLIMNRLKFTFRHIESFQTKPNLAKIYTTMLFFIIISLMISRQNLCCVIGYWGLVCYNLQH